jgi:hypothetical protein
MHSRELQYEDAARRNIRVSVGVMCVFAGIAIGALRTNHFLLAALCGCGAFASLLAMLIFEIMASGDA